jgi:hypothetical protein
MDRREDMAHWLTSRAGDHGFGSGSEGEVKQLEVSAMRQAVVLIHGIGEQEPMGTVRPFVEAVLSDQGKSAQYWSKPDAMSELFELRRLESVGSPKTVFYEYYWAYHMEGTNVWAVVFWALRLISRRKRDVPEGLSVLWWTSRILMLLFVVFLVIGGFSLLHDWFKGQPPYGLLWIAITGVISAVQYGLLYYIGDAARYLSPRPQNIKLRQKIRGEGIKLLRALHESREYDRIIVVGHSLGSVIGYDVITHLWQEFNEALPELEHNLTVQAMVRTRMASQQSPQPIVRDELSRTGAAIGSARDRISGVAAFQKSQLRAWREQRYFGNPWRISDFVTLGSPLAHAMLLIAKGTEDFKNRKLQRELITCPPQRDQKGYAYSAKAINVGPPSIGDEKLRQLFYTPLILHHAAPFAVTRWTNLYFPVRLAFFGDLVGGRLAPAFGDGIKDVQVSTRRWKGFANLTLAAHTSYWRMEDMLTPRPPRGGAPLPALYALKDALGISRLRMFGMTTRFGSADATGKPASSVV